MISSIYKQTPSLRLKPKDVELKYVGPKVEGVEPKPKRETLVVKTSKKEVKPKMKHMDKPKTLKFSKEVKLIARYIFTSWSKAVQECRNEEYLYYPNAVKSDTQPLNKGSVEARICSWIIQNMAEESDDCRRNWEVVIKKLYDGDVLLNKGYGNLPPASLPWLFSYHRNGDWNVNRVRSNELYFKGQYIQRQVEGGV